MTLDPAAAGALVDGAPTVQDAAEALASWAQADTPISRVSVRCLSPDGTQLIVFAVWSEQPTALKPGAVLSVHATAWPELVKTRRPITGTEADVVDEILVREGVRSWISIPLRRDGDPQGVLTFSSPQEAAFAGREDEFVPIGAAVEERLCRLIHPD